MGNRLIRGIVLAAGLLAGLGLEGFDMNSRGDEGAGLQILTDRTSYAPGATMHVTFLVKNNGKTPLYLFRQVGQCTSPVGWLSLQLRDPQDHIAEHWGCSIDDFNFGDEDVVQTLSKQESSVFLQFGEIYGRQEDYKLPMRKGTFRLQAELAPPGLTEEQKQSLSKHQMRVLQSTCKAPTVTITVK